MIGFVFYMQTRFPYVLEDYDYLKNLATGEKLSSVKDIFMSIPEIMRGGGSSLSLVTLQFILLIGERAADFINVLFLLIISYLIGRCSGAKRKNVLFTALPFFLMISLNSDWRYSYLWEFGVVNYLLPAVSFLIFIYMMIYEMASGDKAKGNPTVRAVLACVCAFVCAWSNAAYGLIAVFSCILTIILSKKVLGLYAKRWVWISLGLSISGNFFYLLSSGNFKKVSVMNSQYISFSIFPAVVLALLILAIVLRCGGWLNAVHLFLIGDLCICVALRFIIGFIPGMSINGIQIASLIVSLVLFCSLLRSFIRENPKVTVWAYLLALCSFLYTRPCIMKEPRDSLGKAAG